MAPSTSQTFGSSRAGLRTKQGHIPHPTSSISEEYGYSPLMTSGLEQLWRSVMPFNDLDCLSPRLSRRTIRTWSCDKKYSASFSPIGGLRVLQRNRGAAPEVRHSPYEVIGIRFRRVLYSCPTLPLLSSIALPYPSYTPDRLSSLSSRISMSGVTISGRGRLAPSGGWPRAGVGALGPFPMTLLAQLRGR